VGRFAGLWHERDFLKLWASQTVSVLGNQITALALPLTAALTLDASAAEMGVLVAAERAPFLLFGLVAGVWVDRVRKRPLLIAANLGRAALLFTITLAAVADLLTMAQLIAIAFTTGILTVFFDIAYYSYVPTLVRREQLVEANSKLEVSYSVALVAGPGLAGVLVQLVTAPIAIAVDAGSYLVASLGLARIRAEEPPPTSQTRPPLRRAIAEGLRFVGGHPLIRPVVAASATFTFFGSMQLAVYVLWATRDLELSPALLGGLFLFAGLGTLAGAAVTARMVTWLGLGHAMVTALLVRGVGRLLTPIAALVPPLAVPVLALSGFVEGVGATAHNVNQVSLRQSLTPEHLMGRMIASVRFITWGAMPLGGLAGGALGSLIGLEATLYIGGAGSLLGAVWVWFSPLRQTASLSAATAHSDG